MVFGVVCKEEGGNRREGDTLIIVMEIKDKLLHFHICPYLMGTIRLESRHRFYITSLTNWSPEKVFIAISYTGSADFGFLSKSNNGKWEYLIMDEGSSISVPLNSNYEDTCPIGIGFDFTDDV